MKLRHATMIGLGLLAAGQAVYYFGQLPAVMATHFDGNGVPDGWMTKGSFFTLEFALMCVICVEFLGLPWMIERMPDQWINLPNKSYWLAPERRAFAFEKLRTYFQWFSIALLAIFISVNQLVYCANVTGKNFEPAIWPLLGAFFAFVTIWLIQFILAFRKTS